VITPAGRAGDHVPDRVTAVKTAAPERDAVDRLVGMSGLSSATSDALDALGLRLAVPAAAIPPIGVPRTVVGRAVTLRYLPSRTAPVTERVGALAHRTLFKSGAPGDVAVIAAPASVNASVLGGEALAAARDAGLSGVVVDGAVRDIDELIEIGLPVWAARHTLVTGRGRLDAVEINGPVEIAGVQVRAGDVVVADASGIVFVPVERWADVVRQLLRG
jgi:regulator of RNase E activity RraA